MNYVGTFSIEDYELVKKIVKPIVKKHLVGLSGRGSRVGHPKLVSPWNGKEYNPDYQSYLPLPLSERVSFYVRVEPIRK